VRWFFAHSILAFYVEDLGSKIFLVLVKNSLIFMSLGVIGHYDKNLLALFLKMLKFFLSLLRIIISLDAFCVLRDDFVYRKQLTSFYSSLRFNICHMFFECG
jgi:hypothetical protein